MDILHRREKNEMNRYISSNDTCFANQLLSSCCILLYRLTSVESIRRNLRIGTIQSYRRIVGLEDLREE